MATSYIFNQLGPSVRAFRVPADSSDAQAFAQNHLAGKWSVWERVGLYGNPVATQAYRMRVMIRDNESGKHAFLNFYMKTTKDRQELISLLKGQTINGVEADDVIIVEQRKVVFATDDSSSDSSSGS
jgi:hypothetical protein